ncbi:hypothetical protein FS935_01635 [Metabacillus litoralis]|uniref:Uncharacterized protein n=1 Tax=Metabacillus litoralis TaxID=152268 RepID=A0A5C6W539_9BACI|nr:hypothetical protein [Metabacillus litoralis]TXC92921.1 hypothetical protein FS935_01635 [Metabacillus litoralis]
MINLKRIRFMKLWLVLGSIFTMLTVVGCSSKENENVKYSILVIEGENNISGKFGHFGSNEYSVMEVEYITDLKSAIDKYPDYDIQKAPVVFIFEYGGEMKKMKLKTYDVEEAIDFIEENSRVK